MPDESTSSASAPESTVDSATAAASDASIAFVPSELFFVDCVKLPEGLKEADYAGFAELTVESLSPFPLRDLSYGAWVDASSGSVLVYGALRRRVEAHLGEEMEQARFVLPEFLPACLLSAHTGMTAFSFERIERPSGEPAQDDFSEAQKVHGDKAFNKRPPLQFAVPPPAHDARIALPDLLAGATVATEQSGYRLAEAPTLSDKDALEFSFVAPNEADSTLPKPRLDSEALWLADIRNAAFKAKERQRRRRDAFAMLGFAAVALFALFLLFSQIGVWFYDTQVDQLADKRDAQREEVINIQDRNDLLNTLEQIARAELRPLDVLEALNQVRLELAGSRRSGLHFTEITAVPVNRVRIRGIASTVNDLNRYAEALENSGNFTIIEEPSTRVSGGRTTFGIVVEYTGEFPVLSTAAQRPQQD